MTAITLSNINKRFGEKVLFRDYSLHIEAGEFVAIKGESGAGKTTLLNIIGLLETPDSGSVTLCGARNPSFSSRAAVHLRRHKLSYLFQNYGLVDTDTVEANMKLATRFGKAKGKAEKERIADALAQVGLSGYERRKVYTLSGGEQQRVALARTLTQNPRIILADEPVAALDPVTAKQVMQDFVRINEEMGISILLNIHHVELALEYADRIIGIRAGKIVYDGPSANVDQSVLDAIYGDDSETEADA